MFTTVGLLVKYSPHVHLDALRLDQSNFHSSVEAPNSIISLPPYPSRVNLLPDPPHVDLLIPFGCWVDDSPVMGFGIDFRIHCLVGAGSEGFDILEEGMLWDYVIDGYDVDVDKDPSDRVGVVED
jgi:hypothetical protein